MVIEFVRQKLPGSISHLGSLIGSIMLRKNLSYALAKGSSVPLSSEEIFKEIKSHQQVSFKKDNVRETLDLMSQSEYDIVTKSDGFEDQFTLNVEWIISSIKSKTVEKIVEQEFTQNHCRVYRLLSKCGALDSKNVINTFIHIDYGNLSVLTEGLR
jgi:hypothetical protein